MQTAQELKYRIDQEISKLHYPVTVPGLYKPAQYILDLGGKRIRPLLSLMAANMFSENLEPVIGPALAMEVFHNFTLVHDDIMDEAPLRRGSSTVHVKWDLSTAILSGDVMLIHAYDLLGACQPEHLQELMRMFNRTAREVCEGQRMDMDFEKTDNVTTIDYLEMIRLKTSVLLGCSAYCGAIAMGANKMDAENIYAFGESLGISFQLQDDILDAWGDAESFGKQTGGDILRNKKTFLSQKLIEIADNETRNNYFTIHSDINIDSDQKVHDIIALYEKTGVRKIAEAEMEKYYLHALQMLDEVQVSESKKSVLRNTAKAIYTRAF